MDSHVLQNCTSPPSRCRGQSQGAGRLGRAWRADLWGWAGAWSERRSCAQWRSGRGGKVARNAGTRPMAPKGKRVTASALAVARRRSDMAHRWKEQCKAVCTIPLVVDHQDFAISKFRLSFSGSLSSAEQARRQAASCGQVQWTFAQRLESLNLRRCATLTRCVLERR